MKKIVFLSILLIIPALFVVLWKNSKHSYTPLEKLGRVELSGDTSFFSIPDFSFTDQLGNTITKEDFKGKIYVANFFFASCLSVCPKMNGNLQIVYDKYKFNPNVQFISHTVDPERDDVSVLAEYSKKFNVNPKKWKFVTGKKKDIYALAELHYKVSSIEPEYTEDSLPDFIHSDKLILVDYEGKIRGKGWYASNDMNEILELMDAIKILLKEKSDGI